MDDKKKLLAIGVVVVLAIAVAIWQIMRSSAAGGTTPQVVEYATPPPSDAEAGRRVGQPGGPELLPGQAAGAPQGRGANSEGGE